MHKLVWHDSLSILVSLTITRHPKGVLYYTSRLVGAWYLTEQIRRGLSLMSNLVKHPKAPVDHSSSIAAKAKRLDEARARIRRLNYSIRTEDTYSWSTRWPNAYSKLPGITCRSKSTGRSFKPLCIGLNRAMSHPPWCYLAEIIADRGMLLEVDLGFSTAST